MKPITRLGVVAGLLGSALVAVAAGPMDKEPRAVSYLHFNFGGSDLPSNFRYGLRLDYDTTWHTRSLLPPVLVLDFKSNELNRMIVGGVDVVAIPYMLNQIEVAAAAGSMSTGAVVAVAAGVAATAVVVSNASDSGEEPATTGSSAGGSTTGGSTTGDTTGGGTTGDTTGGGTTGSTTGGTTGSTTGGGLLGGITGGTPTGFVGREGGYASNPEYQDWLDGGTGHMGDLN